MPTRKQRRRRQKLQRHEYEEVYIDAATGEEVEVDPEERAQQKREPKARAAQKASGGRTRTGRIVQPPSWERVARRGAIFAPLMFGTVYLLAPKDNRPITGLVLQTLVLLAFFVPFSYLMDRFTYRAYLRRTGKEPEPRAPKR
jgi:hypothetical protein